MKLVPVLVLALFAGCGPNVMSDDDTTGGDEDSDGDMISDSHEGRSSGTDTDSDGTPDFEDEDSDGDGIPDYREAGDVDTASDPIDSDGDGTPDFRDLDSDANGRSDTVDGVEDLDGDNIGAFADPDDDGDAIDDEDELGPNAQQPVDSDNDGTADFRDIDSDDDSIHDMYEGVNDYDSDGAANFIDLDSDGDCVTDRSEARGAPPADTDLDHHADFIDRDSDNDGVPDVSEDANCNGTADAGESSAILTDTDSDGVTDLVETAAGTNPANPASNPQANGDFVFVEPYQAPQVPLASDLDFSTSLQAVDLYVMLDRSGSMSAEISSIKTNLSNVVRNVACAPLGTGVPPNCIPDLWAGAATIGYQGGGATAFEHWVDVQPNASFSGVPIASSSGGNTQEPLTFGAYAAITGQGGSAFSMGSVPARASCNGSPAFNAGYTTFGYPCFRQGALPVVLLATDEPPLGAGDTFKTPNWTSVVRPAFIARKAKLVGILGDGLSGTTTADLQQMARDTGAVDALNGNAPLVFNGSGANAAAAIQTGIVTLANGLPLDINATTTDDPADAVNAVTAFVDHLETLQSGTAQCANGLTDVDTNSDTFKDKFVQVRTGTPVCWKVVSKPNTTVPATEAPQLFRATVTVYGDGVTQLDTRDVFFLVPPKPFDGPIQ